MRAACAQTPLTHESWCDLAALRNALHGNRLCSRPPGNCFSAFKIRDVTGQGEFPLGNMFSGQLRAITPVALLHQRCVVRALQTSANLCQARGNVGL